MHNNLIFTGSLCCPVDLRFMCVPCNRMRKRCDVSSVAWNFAMRDDAFFGYFHQWIGCLSGVCPQPIILPCQHLCLLRDGLMDARTSGNACISINLLCTDRILLLQQGSAPGLLHALRLRLSMRKCFRTGASVLAALAPLTATAGTCSCTINNTSK